MTTTPEARPRRRRLVAAFVPLGLGLFFGYSGLTRPTIANMRTVDLLHLLATGALLGAGLVAVVLYFVRRHEG